MPLVLLNVFGELEELIADDLYPHRYVVTPIVAGLALGALVAAYRLGVHRVLLRHKIATAIVGLPLLVAGLVAGDYLLSPLWERSTLHEASPLEAAGTAGAAVTPTSGSAVVLATPTAPAEAAGPSEAPTPVTGAAAEPVITHRGMFAGADDFHFGRGDALIIRTAEGNHVLRVESFSVRNGPDLYVYLTTDTTGESVDEALNLGKLKATDGAFNYEIPVEIDLQTIAGVVVWCRQFSTLFALAELAPQ